MSAALLKTWPVVRLTCQKRLINPGASLQPEVRSGLLAKSHRQISQKPPPLPRAPPTGSLFLGFPSLCRTTRHWLRYIYTSEIQQMLRIDLKKQSSSEESRPDFSALWGIRFFVQRVMHTPQHQHYPQWGQRWCVVTRAIPCSAAAGLTRVQWGSLMPNNNMQYIFFKVLALRKDCARTWFEDTSKEEQNPQTLTSYLSNNLIQFPFLVSN